MFLVKIVQKKEIKNSKTNNKKTPEKSEKKKAKWKQSKQSIKKICQANYEKKRSIQSLKPREEILKLKIKVKKYSIIVLFLREAAMESGGLKMPYSFHFFIHGYYSWNNYLWDI